MTDREQCTVFIVSINLLSPFQIHHLIDTRLTPIPAPIRRYSHHLPSAHRRLLGMFDPPP